MKVKDFKKVIENIPERFDNYDIVYSDVQDDTDRTYKRTDDVLSGLVSDDENKKVCLMGYESYQMVIKFNNLEK